MYLPTKREITSLGILTVKTKGVLRQSTVSHVTTVTEIGIFVAVDKSDGKLASCVRVLNRSIYINREEVSMAGVGEVATKDKHPFIYMLE